MIATKIKNLDGLLNVFQVLQPARRKTDAVQSLSNFGKNIFRHADTAGCRNGLNPGGYIDAVSVKIVAFNDHIAQIQANSKQKLINNIERCISFLESRLKFNGRSNSIH